MWPWKKKAPEAPNECRLQKIGKVKCDGPFIRPLSLCRLHSRLFDAWLDGDGWRIYDDFTKSVEQKQELFQVWLKRLKPQDLDAVFRRQQ
jgi:hypothetical protein